MAEETEKIILDIQFDTEQATKNSLELRKSLAELQAQQKTLKAVSYTHLTLPTKRIV